MPGSLYIYLDCVPFCVAESASSAVFVRQKKGEEGSIFYSAKGDIFFRIFGLMSPAQDMIG
jgi:hypothetical protein